MWRGIKKKEKENYPNISATRGGYRKFGLQSGEKNIKIIRRVKKKSEKMRGKRKKVTGKKKGILEKKIT